MKINFRYKRDGQQDVFIEYLLQFLEQHPLKPASISFSKNASEDGEIAIYYGISKAQTEDYFIPKQHLVFQKTEPKTFIANRYIFGQSVVSSVEKESQSENLFIINKNFQFDILETIFFHISRYEEVFAAKEDLNQAGWLDEKKQLLVRHRLQETPVVDHLVKVFFEIISETRIQHKTTYSISHDVDILYRLTPISNFFRSIAANLVYRRGIKDLQNTIRYWWKMQSGKLNDPYDNFDQLMRTEKVWKDKHLFLMVGGNTKFDKKYSIDHPKVEEIINSAIESGYKIGLHPSYNAGFEPNMYSKELRLLSKKLNQNIKLNRQHWLRFNWDITPYLWEENGIEIDASMGFNQHLGFRCGTGFGYHMFDFKKETAFSWKEQPLVFMESAAIHFTRNNQVDLTEIMSTFLLKNKMNTHININFHNSNFDPLVKDGQLIAEFYYHKLFKLVDAS